MIPRRTVQAIPLGSLQPEGQSMNAPSEDAIGTKLNARVVEFIAKPKKTDQLRRLLCQTVTPLLRDRTGFIRSMVLTKHEEARRIVVITFWSTEERTVRDPLEDTPLVRETLAPLIDAWSRTRTYQVDLTETSEGQTQPINLPICLP